MGYLREEQGRYRDALTSYRKATQLDPDYLNAWSKISQLAERMSLPPADREAVALNLLRLDPLNRHSRPDLNTVVDFTRLWNALTAAAKFRVQPPKELYVLPASKAALEKEKEKLKGTRMEQQLDYRFGAHAGNREFHSPGAVISQTRVFSSVSQLIDQIVLTSSADW